VATASAPRGELTSPLFQNAALKVAREELAKAIAIIDRTEWKRRE
jgi:hypothetical protein